MQLEAMGNMGLGKSLAHGGVLNSTVCKKPKQQKVTYSSSKIMAFWLYRAAGIKNASPGTQHLALSQEVPRFRARQVSED